MYTQVRPARYDVHLDDTYGHSTLIDVDAEAARHEPWFNPTLTTVNDGALGLFKGVRPCGGAPGHGGLCVDDSGEAGEASGGEGGRRAQPGSARGIGGGIGGKQGVVGGMDPGPGGERGSRAGRTSRRVVHFVWEGHMGLFGIVALVGVALRALRHLLRVPPPKPDPASAQTVSAALRGMADVQPWLGIAPAIDFGPAPPDAVHEDEGDHVVRMDAPPTPDWGVPGLVVPTPVATGSDPAGGDSAPDAAG